MLAARIRVFAVAALVTVGAAALAFGENTDAASKKVNINNATPEQLAYLPRIGAKVAVRIVERRKEKPFARPEELMEVKGIGEKLFLSLKPYISITGPTTLDSKVRLSSSTRRASSPAPESKEKPVNAVPSGKGR